MSKSIEAGVPPSEGAWKRLVATIDAAKREPDDAKLPIGMNQILITLLGISEYLGSAEVTNREQLALPLFHLLGAIYDLSENRRPALFQPVSPPRNMPGMSAAAANLMAISALAVDLLIQAGVPREGAAHRVSDALKARDPEVIETHKTILDWRYRLREGEGGRAPADALTRYRSPLPIVAGQTPAAQAQWLLRQLRTSPVLSF